MHLSDDAIQVIAGATAGSLTAILTCPLDVVKTRLQNEARQAQYLRDHTTPATLLQTSQSQGQQPQQYMRASTIFRQLWREERFRGLYRGLSPSMAAYLPNWAIYFLSYRRGKETLSEWNRHHHLSMSPDVIHMLSAIGAGALCTLSTNPLWVIKTRIMTQNREAQKYFGLRQSMQHIYREEGWTAFYKGLRPSFFGLAHVAVQFPLYERFKVVFGGEHDVWGVFLASAYSKTIASLVTYPHEVIRTRFHTESTPPKKYRTITGTIRLILREEGGVRAFYAGFGTNLVRTIPASTITLVAYEVLQKVLGNWNNYSSRSS